MRDPFLRCLFVMLYKAVITLGLLNHSTKATRAVHFCASVYLLYKVVRIFEPGDKSFKVTVLTFEF